MKVVESIFLACRLVNKSSDTLNTARIDVVRQTPELLSSETGFGRAYPAVPV